MKLKIFKPFKTRKEGTIQLSLRQAPDGVIELVVYDRFGCDYGSANHILDITEEGIELHNGLSYDIGLPVDADQQVVIV